MKKTLIATVITVALILAGVGYWSLTGRVVSAGQYDNFAKCLTEKNVEMYGSTWCSHCQNQKKMFGDSFKYINYIECTDNPDLCTEKGIQAVPTWIINGKLYTGEKTIEELSALSGCKLS